ncbi:DUF397 domain-containing protein [Streptomyces sp. NBC_00370]|uniref:DUF397 domain-containing protein n=1 Tax=Streptomyces sp. NBC_00370 TaxID=2975728 RepID=UPI002E255ABD
MNSNEHVAFNAVAPLGWRKSSYSGPNNDDCLEVADGHNLVPVRDSKSTHEPALVFQHDSWSRFVQGIKHGEPRGC